MSESTSAPKKRRDQGDGAVYYREDRKRWVAAVDYGWIDGRRVRKEVSGRTKAEVREKLAAELQRHRAGLSPVNERLIVGQFLDSWLEDVVRRSVRASTHVSYEAIVRLHLKPSLGKVRLGRLVPQDVQRLLNEKSDAGLSPRTVREVRGTLGTALNQAVKWGLVDRNVAALADGPKVETYEGTALTIDQAKLFLDACRGNRLEACYMLAFALGLRQGEVLGLCWADIDLDDGTVRLRHQLQRVGVRSAKTGERARWELQLVELKTKAARRALRLPPFAVEALRAHRARQAEARLLAGPAWSDRDLMFSTSIGTPLDPRNVAREFSALREGVEGLPPFTFHDTRRTCSSLLLAKGIHPRVVMAQLGHTQIALTMETYTRVVPDLLDDVAEQMQGLLGGQP